MGLNWVLNLRPTLNSLLPQVTLYYYSMPAVLIARKEITYYFHPDSFSESCLICFQNPMLFLLLAGFFSSSEDTFVHEQLFQLTWGDGDWKALFCHGAPTLVFYTVCWGGLSSLPSTCLVLKQFLLQRKKE